MNICEPAIRRPVGTTLLAIGLLLVGAGRLPLPAGREHADGRLPDHQRQRQPARRRSRDHGGDGRGAARAAARRDPRRDRDDVALARSASTRITVQFDLNRNIDGAARDVQAAINAALTDLPADLPSRPTFRKSNPAATPIMILALTSQHDAAERDLRRRRHRGGAAPRRRSTASPRSRVSGAEQPAIRVRVNPIALASMGLSMEDVRTADRQRQRRRPARHLRRRRARRDHRHQRSAARRLAIRAAGGQSRERHRGAALRHRLDRAGHAQQPLVRLVQPPAVGAAGHHQAGRRQRDRDRRPRRAS